MIYTLTLNPSVDYMISLDSFVEGDINLTKSEYKLAGGKGINVSQVLKNLGEENIALGFVGGLTGNFIKSTLKDKNINTDFVEVEGDTRINIKMRNKKEENDFEQDIETEINGNSPTISHNSLTKLLNKLEKLNSDDILVLSGSVPKSIDSDIYRKIMKKLEKKNIKIILDAKKEALLEGIKGKPYLIKPNNHELGDIFGVKINNLKDIIYYGKKIQKLGAENVIISMAEKGAVLLTKENQYFGNVPKGKLINSVGAGDSLIGGFTFGIANKCDILEAFRYGIACGSASAFSKNLCKKVEVEKLLGEIKVEEIKKD